MTSSPTVHAEMVVAPPLMLLLGKLGTSKLHPFWRGLFWGLEPDRGVEARHIVIDNGIPHPKHHPSLR